MPLTFNGHTFPGVTQTLRPDGHRVELQESKVFGLKGKSVIADAPHGRMIRVRQWINNFASSTALQTYLDVTLPAVVLGQQATLTITGELAETYKECVCSEIDVSPDDRGSLPDDSQVPAKWHRLIQLNFEQLI